MNLRPHAFVGCTFAFLVLAAACATTGDSKFDGSEDAGGPTTPAPTGRFGGGTDPPPRADSPDACAGDACAPPPETVCGDGRIDASETCDDGNAVPGDGCSGICRIEPGYTCPTSGRSCIYTVQVTCGNGLIEGNEACDDGNKSDSDGCSAGCEVEPGYACATPGQACTPVVVARCGDGKVNNGEACDDGNNTASDGCSATCTIEPGFTCPTPGQLCDKLEYCGDGILQGARGEACDDGNAVPGDGCSGVCRIDPGYACPAAGQLCVRIWVCGNGKVDPGEACDDSNTAGGDGCAADCSIVEPGFTCPNNAGSGGPCTRAPSNVCGDGIVLGNEQCDDGNTNANDGCSATCGVEPGFDCPTPGAACTRIAFCGDGRIDLALAEECDDGAAVPGDGCTSQCKLEPNFVCPTPGAPCISTVVCGDGKVTGSETCDDGNRVSADGCSSTCRVEVGWQCPSQGARCIARQCGDGIKAGIEQCDDGDTNDANGCSNNCKLTPGFACTENPEGQSVCTATTCGDGRKEGFEQCDDGNLIPYDGCSPTCTIEPQCAGGQCQAVCGDGFKFAQEECDDGNTLDGDGCSAGCKLEAGFTCTEQVLPPPSTLTIPILYRDMRYRGTTNGHPDFQNAVGGLEQGLVQATLDASIPYGKPVFARAGSTNSNATNFCWWYNDKDCGAAGATNPYARLVYLTAGGTPTALTLNAVSPNVYRFTSNAFFPLNGLGWNAAQSTRQTDQDCSGLNRPQNFAFTSQLHYPFTYQGGERFEFTGDDDVWVFINGRLAVDIGGVHSAVNGRITLSDTANNRCVANSCSTVTMASLGLVVGNMYEISMFQAERHTCASNYTLTLSGFVRAVSQCTPICGDGKLVGDEVCDDGKNDGSYGSCLPGCRGRGPFCGDTVLQEPPEVCDDGVNQTTYGGASRVCGPGCKVAPYCGDGVVSNGEQCDDGAANNTGAYGRCSATCTRGPRCGDGIVSNGEQCDSGINNGAGADRCKADCTLKCGDGTLQAGEQCDDGAANNVGGYGKCNPNCTLGPRCGDGIPNGTEQCDDGKNDSSYGTCKADCTLASFCGDATVDAPHEVCDLGLSNSATAYGANRCTNRCTPAPRCGDRAVDGTFGEVCDDGVNSGQPGSCTSDCKGFVPLQSCGNGAIDPPEQCDTGARNGTANSNCDTRCRLKCGNGIRDPGETCDNGVNDGSYGGCTANCQVAGYCGDGLKNGPEQCDNGPGNVAVGTAYGPGVCTTACTFAPYCGDGRVQASFGEQCDGTASCDSACKSIGPR